MKNENMKKKSMKNIFKRTADENISMQLSSENTLNVRGRIEF